MTGLKVLIVEGNAERVHHWRAVLEFLGYEPVVLPPDAGVGWTPPSQHGWVAVLVGQVNEGAPLAASLLRLRQQCGDLPLAIVDETGVLNRRWPTAVQAGHTHWQIEFPLVTSASPRYCGALNCT